MKLAKQLSAAGAALVCAAAPAAALAHGTPSSHRTAEKQCRTELRTIGKASFRDAYGTNHNKSNAFGRCVAHRSRQDAADQAGSQSNAAQTCRAQESDSSFSSSHDGKTFSQYYGTNGNGANAFGKCVSEQARTQSRSTETDQVKSEDNAAKSCSDEESKDASAFRSKYGTNANGANAFGKCVSETARSNENQSGSSDQNESGSTGDDGSGSTSSNSSGQGDGHGKSGSHGDSGQSHGS